MKQHLDYLDWYYQVAIDLNQPMELLLEKSMVCYNWTYGSKARKELKEYHYGLVCKAWTLYRSMPYVPLALGRCDGHIVKFRRDSNDDSTEVQGQEGKPLARMLKRCP